MQTAEPRRPHYLEDLHIGLRRVTETYRVDEAEINAFAAQYDPQPFHLDEEAARASVFHGLAASGWHTSAITMRLIVTSSRQVRSVTMNQQGEPVQVLVAKVLVFKQPQLVPG